MVTRDPHPVQGEVAPGFEQVKSVFEENFTRRSEIGAACTAYHDGLKVMDLWGGIRDEQTGAEWEEGTMGLVSSTAKGMTSLAVALAYSRGYLDLDERVCTYWPEFTQNGKQTITIRQLMAHQAGLSSLDKPPTNEDVQDLDKLADILVRQHPLWEPGTRQGYHANTFGWYVRELIRCVDPVHRPPGRFFAEEIAKPLGLEFYIGLPQNIPDSRLALIKDFGLLQILAGVLNMPFPVIVGFFSVKPLSKGAAAFPMPDTADVRKRKQDFLAVEGLGYNGVGTACSIAKVYSIFATGAKELALQCESLEALMTALPPPSKGDVDLVTGLEMRFSLGCCKPFREYEFGSSARAFGMPGLVGSFGDADPDTGSGFAYVPNKWFFRLHDDPRQIALWKAFQSCLKNTRH